MRLRSLFALAAVAIPASLAAQSAEVETSYDHIHQRTLANGLDVVVIEAPALPIVTIEIAARNGAFTEPPELNGLSHLYEHMFFKANAAIPSQEAYMARQRELGMVWNGTTGSERVNYFFTLQRDDLEGGLAFMADAIRTPLFLEEELIREREVVIGEFDRNEADPGYHLYHALDQALWYAHPTRKDPLGDRPTILSATPEQMRWMQETYYIPNNSLLVLSGAVSAEEGFALAEEYLGEWEAGPDPFEAYPIPEHPPLVSTVARLVPQEIGVSVIALAWHGPDTRNDIDATYAADVFSFVLGQAGSEFQRTLVESGLALQAGIGYQTMRYTGQIQATMAVVPGREEAAIAALLGQIERFDDPDYITAEQIEAAARQLAISDLYTQQDVTDLAHTVSYWWASASLDYYLGYIDALRAVTRDDMDRYVRRYIQGQPLVAALMTAPQVLEAGNIDEAWLLERVTQEVVDAP